MSSVGRFGSIHHRAKQQTTMKLKLELELPDSIIQHVQSFLSEEDALRSCILSKSWLRSYSTLPVLKFVENRFHGDDKDKFVRAVNDALLRYRQHKLRIQSLELFIQEDTTALDINNWLDIATECCGLEKLNLEFFRINQHFELPLKILNAKTLRQARFVNCIVPQPDIGLLLRSTESCFLVTLDLRRVVITQFVLDHLLCNSPSMEKLILCECRGFTDVTVGGTNLKEFHITLGDPDPDPAEAEAEAEVEVYVYGKYEILPIPYSHWAKELRKPSTYSFDACQNLTNLELSCASITGSFFSVVLVNFPFLASLVLDNCLSMEHIQVRHDLLESLKIFYCHELVQIEIECPKLKFLTYFGMGELPHFFLAKEVNVAELETTLHLCCPFFLDHSWFLSLCQRLLDLNHCYQLSLEVGSITEVKICFSSFEEIPYLAIVENVYLEISSDLRSLVRTPNWNWIPTVSTIMDAIRSICYPMKLSMIAKNDRTRQYSL